MNISLIFIMVTTWCVMDHTGATLADFFNDAPDNINKAFQDAWSNIKRVVRRPVRIRRMGRGGRLKTTTTTTTTTTTKTSTTPTTSTRTIKTRKTTTRTTPIATPDLPTNTTPLPRPNSAKVTLPLLLPPKWQGKNHWKQLHKPIELPPSPALVYRRGMLSDDEDTSELSEDLWENSIGLHDGNSTEQDTFPESFNSYQMPVNSPIINHFSPKLSLNISTTMNPDSVSKQMYSKIISKIVTNSTSPQLVNSIKKASMRPQQLNLAINESHSKLESKMASTLMTQRDKFPIHRFNSMLRSKMASTTMDMRRDNRPMHRDDAILKSKTGSTGSVSPRQNLILWSKIASDLSSQEVNEPSNHVDETSKSQTEYSSQRVEIPRDRVNSILRSKIASDSSSEEVNIPSDRVDEASISKIRSSSQRVKIPIIRVNSILRSKLTFDSSSQHFNILMASIKKKQEPFRSQE